MGERARWEHERDRDVENVCDGVDKRSEGGKTVSCNKIFLKRVVVLIFKN